jgi:hypothetical protein
MSCVSYSRYEAAIDHDSLGIYSECDRPSAEEVAIARISNCRAHRLLLRKHLEVRIRGRSIAVFLQLLFISYVALFDFRPLFNPQTQVRMVCGPVIFERKMPLLVLC